MILTDLEAMFHSVGFDIPDNIKQDISFSLPRCDYINKHYSFILDLKTHKILSYSFNIYYKSDSFPFSVHAEIQSIIRLFRSRIRNKNKKALLVVKLSRTGIIGNSKCCLNCMKFIRGNMDILNMKKIYHSNANNVLSELYKEDLIDDNFKPSKGFVNRTCKKKIH
jgi:cytidine deaminase